MYLLISVLIINTCVLLILIALVQNSKGGGLASNFASSNQVMGVRKTADFLEKATWTLAIGLLVLSLLATLTLPRNKVEAGHSDIEEKIETTQTPGNLPSFPTTEDEGSTQEQGEQEEK